MHLYYVRPCNSVQTTKQSENEIVAYRRPNSRVGFLARTDAQKQSKVGPTIKRCKGPTRGTSGKHAGAWGVRLSTFPTRRRQGTPSGGRGPRSRAPPAEWQRVRGEQRRLPGAPQSCCARQALAFGRSSHKHDGFASRRNSRPRAVSAAMACCEPAMTAPMSHRGRRGQEVRRRSCPRQAPPLQRRPLGTAHITKMNTTFKS
jgi:hypothetical protein